MTALAEMSPDGCSLTVQVPLTIRKRGGRKRILAPDGTAVLPVWRGLVDRTLVKALARAYRWQGLLESGAYSSVAELAAAERINASYLARVLRLTLLAPAIVEAVLDGRQPHAMTLDRLLKPFPVEWEEQRF